MSKYYFFNDGDENCFDKAGIIDMMKFNGLKTKKVWEAKIVIGSSMMYCIKLSEVGEKGFCGKNCKHYRPRNGKSGICSYTGNLYEPVKQVLFKI